MSEQCEHGNLKRQCLICELQDELNESRQECMRLSGNLGKLAGEVERLKAENAELREALREAIHYVITGKSLKPSTRHHDTCNSLSYGGNGRCDCTPAVYTPENLEEWLKLLQEDE